mgnify:CR=1 FL=1|jgi:hypothetical protein
MNNIDHAIHHVDTAIEMLEKAGRDMMCIQDGNHVLCGQPSSEDDLVRDAEYYLHLAEVNIQLISKMKLLDKPHPENEEEQTD